mgnify:CR=1 FL=1
MKNSQVQDLFDRYLIDLNWYNRKTNGNKNISYVLIKDDYNDYEDYKASMVKELTNVDKSDKSIKESSKSSSKSSENLFSEDFVIKIPY